MDLIHPPNLGPALHMHPKGSETGKYEFILDGKHVAGKPGDVILVPKAVPHRFIVGSEGGHALVNVLQILSFIYFKVSELLYKAKFRMKQNQIK